MQINPHTKFGVGIKEDTSWKAVSFCNIPLKRLLSWRVLFCGRRVFKAILIGSVFFAEGPGATTTADEAVAIAECNLVGYFFPATLTNNLFNVWHFVYLLFLYFTSRENRPVQLLARFAGVARSHTRQIPCLVSLVPMVGIVPHDCCAISGMVCSHANQTLFINTFVGMVGVEPTWFYIQRFLRPSCLPVSTHRLNKKTS